MMLWRRIHLYRGPAAALVQKLKGKHYTTVTGKRVGHAGDVTEVKSCSDGELMAQTSQCYLCSTVSNATPSLRFQVQN